MSTHKAIFPPWISASYFSNESPFWGKGCIKKNIKLQGKGKRPCNRWREAAATTVTIFSFEQHGNRLALWHLWLSFSSYNFWCQSIAQPWIFSITWAWTVAKLQTNLIYSSFLKKFRRENGSFILFYTLRVNIIVSKKKWCKDFRLCITLIMNGVG